ncbi:MAG TPA: MFS transporter [Acidimicrobiales bacterium]|nr:MFS transporter [Acidimicrobiales bacterium]
MAEPLPDRPEDDATVPMAPVARPAEADVARPDGRGPRLLGSTSFFRLWMAQVVSSLGDWIGLFAILTLTARIGKGSPEAAIALVMSARMIPGFFLASVGGVLVDRWDRRKVMVTCDIGRGLVLATLPLVKTVWGLFLASLVLEVLTLLWSPAKEASVPNLVPADKLASANSFSLAAAYGTFPVGSALFASLTKVAEILGRHAGSFGFLRLNQESLAIYFDVVTFFLSASLIYSLTLVRNRPVERTPIDLTRTFSEIKEGWHFIGTNPTVRSVMVGLGTGLVGGGMIAPLGPIYANEVLHAGAAGFGLLLTALGMGVAVGVVGLSTFQKRVPHGALFPWAVVGAGVAMLVAVTMSSLGLTMLFIAFMGVCAGAVYVLGFTILQETVADELRGRTFATLYTLSRLCMLISLSLAPLVSRVLDDVSHAVVGGELGFAGTTLSLPGVRLTLWAGGAIILAAGGLALRAYRETPREAAA